MSLVTNLLSRANDATRLSEGEVTARALEPANGERKVTEHMSTMVVDGKQYDGHSTRIICDRLGIPLRRRPLEEHDGSAEVGVPRIPRLTPTEHLRPLHQLTGEAFVRAWFQCAQGVSPLAYVQFRLPEVQC